MTSSATKDMKHEFISFNLLISRNFIEVLKLRGFNFQVYKTVFARLKQPNQKRVKAKFQLLVHILNISVDLNRFQKP